MRWICVVMVAALMMGGCDKKNEEPGGNPDRVGNTNAPEVKPEAAAQVEVPKADEPLIPIEYKQAAEKEITADNAAAAAERLAKEIDEDIE